jgi:hypothetical protein
MKQKYILLKIFPLLALIACTPRINLQNPDESLGSPKGAVMTFFEALKMGADRTTFRKIMSPRLKVHRDKVTADEGNSYDTWLALWKKQAADVQSIGEPEPSRIDADHIEVTRVPITFLVNGQPKQTAIRVAKYGDKWYWDEN